MGIPQAANEDDTIRRDSLHALSELRADMRACHDILADLNSTAHAALHILARDNEQGDSDQAFTFAIGKEYRIDHQGRKFVYVWSPVALPGVSIIPYGIQGYIASFPPGWSLLPYPDQTVISANLLNGAIQNVIFRATNTYLGDAV